MTAAADQVEVLARIDADRFFDRPRAERKEVCAWLLANGIDPTVVTVRRDVEVVLLDAPAIVREEYVLGPDRRVLFDRAADDAVTRVVHSLLRVPLPAHLADPL